MKKLFQGTVVALSLAVAVQAAETPADKPKSLDSALEALSTPGNQAPAGVTGEQLYAVQTRYSPLRHRLEISVGGSSNFNSDGFLASRGFDANARYYLTNRWYLSLAGGIVFNDYTAAGERHQIEFNEPPDVAVVTHRADFQVGYNLLYGKLRVTMDKVIYFDQYVALGPGMVFFHRHPRSFAAVADVGLAIWFGRKASVRLGFKDYYGYERREKSSSMEHDLLGYVQAGFVFGG